MKRFDVIVVGGGIIGATTAAMMAHMGMEVALLDSAACGSRGGSAYSGGIVRLYDEDPAMRQLGRRAVQLRRDHPVGQVFDRAIHRTGVLYCASASAEPGIRAALTECDALFEAQLVSRSNLQGITDFVAWRRGSVYLYEPSGGHSDVRLAVQLMLRIVRGSGLVIEHAPVERLATGREGADVHLCSGAVLSARVVVVAAGPWTGGLLRAVLSTLPVEARSVPLGLVAAAATPGLPVIDMQVGSYVVPFGEGIVGVGCGPRHAAATPASLPDVGADQAADSLDKLAQIAGPRARAAGGVRSLGVLAGLDSYTPDGRPVAGFMPSGAPIYVLTGFNGLGFKIAPAIADLAATEIHAHLHDVAAFPVVPTEAFGPARFAVAPDAFSCEKGQLHDS